MGGSNGMGVLECVHDSMKLATSCWDPCRMWLHYISYPMDPPPFGNCTWASTIGIVFDPSIPPVYFCNSAHWAKIHNQCVHDSMKLANSSLNPYLVSLHYSWYLIGV